MSPPFGISRRNAASQGGSSRIRSKVSAVSAVGSGGGGSGSGATVRQRPQAGSRSASRSHRSRMLALPIRGEAHQLERPGVALPREVLLQRRRERRVGAGGELEQRHRGA